MDNSNKKTYWGKGIFIFYVLFVIGMFSLIKATTTANLDLVNNSYYSDSEKYQEVIDAQKRTSQLTQKPAISLDNESIIISIPATFDDSIKNGTVLIYSPSSAKEDIKVTADFKTGTDFKYTVTGLRRGIWDVNFTWQDNPGQNYTLTKRIDIP